VCSVHGEVLKPCGTKSAATLSGAGNFQDSIREVFCREVSCREMFCNVASSKLASAAIADLA
jgi:hypothetical protein